jgi:hypothetical protein
LLTLSEGGPSNLDVMGVGTSRPGYEASWNTYDRLVTYGVKKDADGNDHYASAKIVPELAESWDLGDMSVTFKLRKDAKFHDGTPVTAKDVKWPFERAVTVGGAPTFQVAAGSIQKPEQFVAVDDYTVRIDFLRKGQIDSAGSHGVVSGGDQFRIGQETCDGQGPVGDGLAKEQRSRRRRLQDREMDARTGIDLPALR